MIRIEANYAATDGSTPERIEITWDDTVPTGGSWPCWSSCWHAGGTPLRDPHRGGH